MPVRPAAPAARDNLQRISGIDAEAEKLLIAQGISRYSQMAHWPPAEVQRLDRQLGATGRIGRENWIEQAQILSRGGDTAFSRGRSVKARDSQSVAGNVSKSDSSPSQNAMLKFVGPKNWYDDTLTR